MPADGCEVASPAYPARTVKVSMALAARSVTTRVRPLGLNWTWAASVSPPAGLAVRPRVGAGQRREVAGLVVGEAGDGVAVVVEHVAHAVVDRDAHRTVPPEGMRSVTATSPPSVLSAEMVSSPALTTNSSLPSRAMPPWDASDAPAPRPPVGDGPDGVERAVGVPVVDGDGVPGRVVGGLVDVPDDGVVGCLRPGPRWPARRRRGRGRRFRGGLRVRMVRVLSKVMWSRSLRPTSSGRQVLSLRPRNVTKR